MSDKNLNDLLKAGSNSKLSTSTIKKYSDRKQLTGLDIEWEKIFDTKIKGVDFEGSYASFIRTCIMNEVAKYR